MHAITLAELASSFVGVVPTLIHQRLVPPHESALALWTTHRSRCDEWNYRLAAHRDSLSGAGITARARKWHEVMPVLQEVLLTEPLTRTLACFAMHLEERNISDEFTPLMHSNLVSHIEARHRCLNLIVFGQGLSVEASIKLNRMRRQLENYTDHLLATMPATPNIEGFCFDIDTVNTARRSLGPPQSVDSQSERWLQMHMQGLEHLLWRSLQTDIDWRAANGRLNHRISQTVLGLLPNELFDSLGLPRRISIAQVARQPSPESDGKPLDPAASASPLSLLHAPRLDRKIRDSHSRRRW